MKSQFLEITDELNNLYNSARRDSQRVLLGFENVFTIRNEELNSSQPYHIEYKAEKAEVQKRIAKAQLAHAQVTQIFDLIEEVKTMEIGVQASHDDVIRQSQGISMIAGLLSSNLQQRAANQKKQQTNSTRSTSLDRLLICSKDMISTSSRQMLVEVSNKAKFNAL